MHERSDCHNETKQIKILAATTEQIRKEIIEKFFLKFWKTCFFLFRQGLPMLGDSNNGNFTQLLLSETRYDSPIYKWLEKKADKFTHTAFQNECLKLMYVSILQNISKTVKQSRF